MILFCEIGDIYSRMTSLPIDISLIVEDLSMGIDFIIFIGICLHVLPL